MANTKRALLTSVLAIVACVAMLIGSTFAWFTDTASTGVNKIQAGSLKIDIVDEAGNSLKDKTLDFVKAESAPKDEKILWEPGCTYELPAFKIVNKGNLALKYKVVINGVDGDAKLLEAIDFFVVKNGEEKAELADWEGVLLPKGTVATDGTDVETTKSITISGHMKEDAGNDYQGLSIEGISIKVYATQYTYESDSFNNEYDKNATYYPVIDYAGWKGALTAGGDVEVTGDFTADANKTASADRILITKPTTIDFGGMITVPGELEDSNNWAALYINAETTINGTETTGITCVDKTDPNASYNGGPYVAHVNAPGKTVTVNGGYYYGGCTTFNVQSGTLIVNGGFFQVTPDIGTKDYRYTLNCIDASYKDGTAKIIVRGGTFVNFDPSNNAAEGAGTNFVDKGYTVVTEKKANGDVWYTVVSTSDADGLKDVLAKGGELTISEDIKTNNSADTVDARVIITKPTTLNLSGKIITPDNMGRNNTNFTALIVDADTTINADENGGIDTGKNGGYGINVRKGATLTINGGSYYGGGTTVQVQEGTLIINGGTFACEPYDNPVYGSKYLINCIDSAWKDGTAKIEIYGGTFINFDPSDSASENPHGNFVADGYKVNAEKQANGDIWYTVVKA